jgi:ComF family protein
MTLIAQARPWLETVLGFVYPNVCQLCGSQRAAAAEGYVCARCWQGVRFIKPPFCRRCGLPFAGDLTTPFECANCREMNLRFRFARSAVVATGVVLEVIHRFKYQRALWFEPFLADLLVRAARPDLARADWDFIVPVPLHPTREREREFNQAARLAAHLARATGIPVHSRLLRRRVATRTQTQLNRSERAANVRRAFALRPHAVVKGARLLLLDDVLTTGATTSACAGVLQRAGAADIGVWTVARGL